MFNDKCGLTKAVLEGRKTMTRRIVPEKLIESYCDYNDYVNAVAPHDIPCSREYEEKFFLRRSRFEVGETVSVAQNYNDVFDEFATIVYLQNKPVPDNFKAFGSHSDVTLPSTMPGWNNKMFVRADLMPHQIRITGVRTERLRDISDEDCLREGIYEFPFWEYSWEDNGARFDEPREAFADLIDKVSGKGTWKLNPWVYVYEFELVK